MKKFISIMKKIGGGVMFLLGYDCEARRQAANDCICDFSGQGRDKYGR